MHSIIVHISDLALYTSVHLLKVFSLFRDTSSALQSSISLRIPYDFLHSGIFSTPYVALGTSCRPTSSDSCFIVARVSLRSVADLLDRAAVLLRALRAKEMLIVNVGFDISPKPRSSGLLNCLRRVSTFSGVSCVFILYWRGKVSTCVLRKERKQS